MFERNTEFKNNYRNTLEQINKLSVNIKTDNDKIRLLELINNLKFRRKAELEEKHIVSCINSQDE